MKYKNENDSNGSFLPKKVKENNGFKVPEGYFENFDNQIWKKITELEKSQSTPKKSKINTVYMWSILAVAASLLGFMIWFFSSPAVEDISTPQLASDSSSIPKANTELEEYLFSNEVSISDIIMSEESSEELTSDQLLAYLEDQNYSEYLLSESN